MQFLYPNVLWALFTLIIPIIIHLFNFRRYKTVYFSNVAFLKNIRKETKSRSNLKNILILISRLLAIVFLVLVFARPYIPNEKDLQMAENPYVAVYIDNSFSMDAEGKKGILLESAKVKAKELTALFPRSTKYLLQTNEFALLHQRFVSSEQFIEWVSQIQSTHVVRKLDEVIDKISVLLPESDSNIVHSLFVLSDFQKNILEDSDLDISSNLKLYAIPFYNKVKDNLFIDSVWFETPGHYKGKQETVFVNIQNISDETYLDIPVQLFINDSIVSTITFDMESNASKEIAIPFTKWEAGFYKARVEIIDYPITFDNTLYFNFEIKEKKSVLLINGNDIENYLPALFKDDENIKSISTDIKNIKYNSFKNYEVIVLNGINNLSSGLINEVVKYTKQGGTIVFIPDTSGNLNTYKELFGEVSSIKIENFVEQEGSVDKINLNSELFKSAFTTDLNDIRYPHYKGFYPISVPQISKAVTLFSAESGSPLFIQIPLDKGQCYISAFPLNSEITDFGTHPLFVPLYYNIVLYSSSPSDLFYWIKPGLFSQVTKKDNSEGSLSMIEEITEKELKPKYNLTQQNIIIYPKIDNLSAGHYGLKIGGALQNYISYNFDRAESQISYYTMGEVKELFANSGDEQIQIVDSDSKKIAKTIKQQTQGKPLSILFLWLALSALILEMVLLRFLK